VIAPVVAFSALAASALDKFAPEAIASNNYALYFFLIHIFLKKNDHYVLIFGNIKSN
jgi:hypothetical protein